MKKIFFMAALAAMTLASCTGGASGEQKEAAVQQKNEVIETIMSRRSIRQYKDMPVERTKMDTILMCGINAPNGMNRQSWEIRVVGKEYIDGVTKLYVEENPDAAKDPSFKNIFRNAPVAVLVAADTEYEQSRSWLWACAGGGSGPPRTSHGCTHRSRRCWTPPPARSRWEP